MEKRRSISRFLWGRVEDYCSWIHSLELLGRKVKLWVSRKHISSFKNACFTLRYYSIPLIILWVLVLLWLLNDTVTCPWGDQGRVWVEWCTASEAETYFVPPLRCLNWSRWICSSSNQPSCLTGIFIQKKLPTFWNLVTILRRRAVGLFRDCGWKGDIDFKKWVEITRYWSARLHLSPCMAGATLVAAGNGAPDLVMTALAGPPRDSMLVDFLHFHDVVNGEPQNPGANHHRVATYCDMWHYLLGAQLGRNLEWW